jgi:hypothetical protein
MRIVSLIVFCNKVYKDEEDGLLTKEDSYVKIKKYVDFLSKKLSLDMFVGKSAIFKNFKISNECNLTNNCKRTTIFKGNKYVNFDERADGTYYNDSWCIVDDLIRNDVDVIDVLF